MLANTVAHSALLLEFVEPISLDIRETGESIYQRCRMGMTVWNYYVSRKFNLPMFAAIEKVVTDANAKSPDFKAVVDFLLQRKQEFFDDHNNIILTVERRTKPDGSSSIYAESAPPQIIAKANISEVIDKILSGTAK